MSRKTNTVCLVCKSVFYKRPSQKKGNNFCSTICYSKYKTKDKTKICKTCNNAYKYNRRDQQFCSTICAASRPRAERSNDNGRNKSQTIQSKFRKLGWDGKCMIKECGYNNTLDVHRINEGINGGKYEISNISILCPNHHSEIHRLKFRITKIKELEFILCN